MIMTKRVEGRSSRCAAGCCWVLLLCLSSAQHAAGAPRAGIPSSCPGLQQGVCTAACQLATCTALADFYTSTFNPDKPWDTKPWADKQGWELTESRSCQQLLAGPARVPSYCSWNGVSCCDPAGLAEKQCSYVQSVSELKVQVNGLNGTLGSPGIINNLLQLHACGLTRLSLQGNDLTGSMTPEWGLMTNLLVLDLCEFRQQHWQQRVHSRHDSHM
eukprot:GHRQ01021538.1.p1 GENE.GHRQ01021538.1~~GHRQ01021538.1.p1  ORF type:complete len:216 (+),score=58.65 GHRQ01021538.1:258-905(+)